ncbi:MAG: methyltransferase [Balneolaceae bacterium]|nr:methyltransferase [Balneolaceae bacterium]
MSKIAYDPVKDRFAGLIRRFPRLRTLFFMLLDLFFLRSWYVRRVVRNRASDLEKAGEWKMLDAGGGFGQYDRFLLNRFRNVRVTSVDVKEEYLQDCRSYFREQIERNRIEFRRQDLLALDEEAAYDFTICIDVLEHIEQDERVIGNLSRALKPGGWFLMHSPSHYAEEDAGEEETFVGEHARTGYSRQEITRKLEQAGLRPVEVEYTYGKAGHFAWEMLIKYPMLLLNRVHLLALPLLLVYYPLTLPFGLLLMKRDLAADNEWGTGIYALARSEKREA